MPGRVYVVRDLPPADSPIAAAAWLAFEDTEPADRFGTATAVGDFNGDGCADLAVGAAGWFTYYTDHPGRVSRVMAGGCWVWSWWRRHSGTGTAALLAALGRDRDAAEISGRSIALSESRRRGVDGDRAAGDLEVATPISITNQHRRLCHHHPLAGGRPAGAVEAPMPMYRPDQRSFLDIQREEQLAVQEDPVVWVLVHYGEILFPGWLTRGWSRGEGRRGRKAWPIRVVLALVVLRWSEEGMSRVGACRRARTDSLWRYAMGLPMEGRTPTEKTVREVEAWLQQEQEKTGLTRLQALYEHVVHVALWSAERRGKGAPKWFEDSTPMWCFGQVLDTVRLLGDGLRRLGRAWARATGRPVGTVAHAWELPLIGARSTKGWLRIDWSDRKARAKAITGVVEDVLRVVKDVRATLSAVKSSSARAQVGGLCDLLLRAVAQDVERDGKGQWRVARKVAHNRMVSLTDPEAGHGHKSRSESFWGYKINVLGDLVSGVIAAVSVTPGNGHDAAPGLELVVEARRMRLEIRKLLADTAYGGIENRLALLALGVDLVAPPPGKPREKGKTFSKNAFAVDFEALTATCPNGVTTDQAEQTAAKVPTLAFRWPVEACRECPLRAKCLRQRTQTASEPGKRKGRPPQGKRLVLDVFDRERREARAAWEDPERREEYRDRSMGERLNALLVQHGARRARLRGRKGANLQAQLIGITLNLGVVARNVAEAKAQEKARTRRAGQPTQRQQRVAGRAARAEQVAARRDLARQLPLA